MGPGTSKYRVTLEIEVSNACIKRVDNGIEHPEEFVKAELGWAKESFDGMEIKEFRDTTDGADPTAEEMIEKVLEAGGDTVIDVRVYGYGRGYITDGTDSGKFEQMEFRDEGNTAFQPSFRAALKEILVKLKIMEVL